MTVTPESVNAEVAKLWPTSKIRCIELSTTHALVEFPTSPKQLRPGGFISGPTQFAAADMVMWFMVAGAAGQFEAMALTSELSIRFLRPAVGTTLFARAELERAGRRTVVCTVRIWTDDNEDRPCAAAQGTYMRPERSGQDA